jgi:hypothetical protein
MPNIGWRKSLDKRLWGRLRLESSGCMVWTGSLAGGGYGKIWWEGKLILVHCLVWTLKHGPIPDGMWVLHSCDNPPCANVAHLFIGTRQINMDDMVNKGRSASGERNWSHQHPDLLPRPGAKLTPERVAVIRSKAASGKSYAALALEFGVSKSGIWKIVTLQTWK